MSGLVVEHLTVGVRGQPAALLRDVSFDVTPGEIVGLVGESGSGKTMASLAIMGLLPPAMELRGGSVRVDGTELVDQASMEVRRTARQLTMIFQQPQAALNPTMRVGAQIARVLRLHHDVSASAATSGAIELLERVGIPGPARVAKAYPHQLSGGMCQRVMIAIALACRPRLLLADEPTTALDVTIQAQVFDLLRDLTQTEGCGVLFITHDLAAVSELCDRVTVLYGGQLMEDGVTPRVLHDPAHPYSRYLLDAVEREVGATETDLGVNFDLVGCRFGHRCPHADAACATFPERRELDIGHHVRCHHPLTAPVDLPGQVRK